MLLDEVARHDLQLESEAAAEIGDPKKQMHQSSDDAIQSGLPSANHPGFLIVVDIGPTEQSLEPVHAFSSNFHKSGAFQVDLNNL